MKCYLCGGENLKIVHGKLRYDIKRNVLECQKCFLTFLEPKTTNLKNFYSADYRKVYTPTPGKAMKSEEIFKMLLPYQEARIKEIKHLLRPDIKALEVGSSAGYFLHALKPFVGECVGIEFNKENAEFANNLGIKTYTEPIEKTDLRPESFDLIILFQILEHIENPISFLENLSRYLKKDGYICVEVPNLNDALLSIYKVEKFADFWFVEPHLYYFTANTLAKIMEKSGFKGAVKSTQEYNFINHVNWFLTGKPQESAEVGMRAPRLVVNKDVKSETAEILNDWIRKVDDDYRALLEKLGLGGKLLFIGKRI